MLCSKIFKDQGVGVTGLVRVDWRENLSVGAAALSRTIIFLDDNRAHHDISSGLITATYHATADSQVTKIMDIMPS